MIAQTIFDNFKAFKNGVLDLDIIKTPPTSTTTTNVTQPLSLTQIFFLFLIFLLLL